MVNIYPKLLVQFLAKTNWGVCVRVRLRPKWTSSIYEKSTMQCFINCRRAPFLVLLNKNRRRLIIPRHIIWNRIIRKHTKTIMLIVTLPYERFSFKGTVFVFPRQLATAMKSRCRNRLCQSVLAMNSKWELQMNRCGHITALC